MSLSCWSVVTLNQKADKTIEERFIEYLRQAGKKVTEERLLILRTIYATNKHLTAMDLCLAVEQQHSKVSRATVYRTLEILVEADLVTKLALDGYEARYEASLAEGHHDHIICTDCFKIMEFYDEGLEKIQDKILQAKGFKAVSHVHNIYAECLNPMCPEKLKKKTDHDK
ncbi:MAG: transcriptional repressor [Acidobacteria bacterium]|nr:MAG: transcriptional repressor [Acidobacteriota bacterium]